MKRFTMVALTALMVFALTVPAWALETQFGGYWRFRGWTAQNMTGEDKTEAWDVTATDLRARLYFTTIFHENLKFVTKFEMDTQFGVDKQKEDKGGGNWGGIGADGTNLEIKNAYVDFNLGALNFKVGVQGAALARGFLFDDDFAGIVATVNAGNLALPLIWIKAYEGGYLKDTDYPAEQNAAVNYLRSANIDVDDFDVDYFGVNPIINAGSVRINPFFLYAHTEQMYTAMDIDDKEGSDRGLGLLPANEMNLWYAGLNIDANFDAASIWLTGIYQGGDIDLGPVQDFKAWLAAGGFAVNLPFGDIHAQAFYATGDDDPTDKDLEKFWVPKGQCYYWAEIMGYGVIGDNYYSNVSNNSPADQIGNIMAGNFGVTIKPMDKLTISLDAWYAALAEDIDIDAGPGVQEENYLGTEVDLRITIQLVQGLNLDLVGAYLFAGEATTLDSVNEADPYEVGTMLSLSF